ncbi:hypothetical protein [Cellulosimicrobium sp. KWT-B]|uniref:hypothetical protein n=1 Tax=Cellulosimicrobium sp. KWT-B TaxID=1981152 RepID=UPI0011783F3C|nr:hypothetical protein [Cellulosimicrobium sp. KWT-B]
MGLGEFVLERRLRRWLREYDAAFDSAWSQVEYQSAVALDAASHLSAALFQADAALRGRLPSDFRAECAVAKVLALRESGVVTLRDYLEPMCSKVAESPHGLRVEVRAWLEHFPNVDRLALASMEASWAMHAANDLPVMHTSYREMMAKLVYGTVAGLVAREHRFEVTQIETYLMSHASLVTVSAATAHEQLRAWADQVDLDLSR